MLLSGAKTALFGGLLLLLFRSAAFADPAGGCQPHHQVNPSLAGICRQNAEILAKRKAEYEELLKKKTESMRKSASAFAAGDQTTEAAVENAKRMFATLAAEQDALTKEVEKKRKDVGAIQQNYEDNLGKMLKSKVALVNEINQKSEFIANERKALRELQMGRDPSNSALIADKQRRLQAADSQLAELNKKRNAFDSAISADRASQGQAKVLAQKFKVSESELQESSAKLRGQHARLSGVSLDSSSQIAKNETKLREEVAAEKAKLADLTEKESASDSGAEGKLAKPAEPTGSQRAVGAALAEAGKEDASPKTFESSAVLEGKQRAAEGKDQKYFTEESGKRTELLQAEQSLGVAKRAVERNEAALAEIGGQKGLAEKLRESAKVYSGLEADVDGMPKSDTEGLKMAQEEWRKQYEKDCKNPAVCSALNSYGIKPEMTVGTGCVGSGICGVEKKTWDPKSGLNDIPVPTNGEQVVKTEKISKELSVAASQKNFEADASSRLRQMNADTLQNAEDVKKAAELSVANQQIAEDSAARIRNSGVCDGKRGSLACAAAQNGLQMAQTQADLAGGDALRRDPLSAGNVAALAEDPRHSNRVDQNVRHAAKLEEITGTTETVLGFTPVAGSLYGLGEAEEKLKIANAAVVRTGGTSELASSNLIEAKENLSSAKTMMAADVALSATGLGGAAKAGAKAADAGLNALRVGEKATVTPLIKSTDNVAEAVVRDTYTSGGHVADDVITATPRVATRQDEAYSTVRASAGEEVQPGAHRSQTAKDAELRVGNQARAEADEALSASRAQAFEDNRLNAYRNQSAREAQNRATEAQAANDNVPLPAPRVSQEARASSNVPGAGGSKEITIYPDTVPEMLAKENIPHTPLDHSRAVVTPGTENKLSRTAAKVENKYDAKLAVDEAVDERKLAGWATKDELTVARGTVGSKEDLGPLLAHEVEHVKNLSRQAKRVDNGDSGFDWRNITFGSSDKPTGIPQYDQLAADEVAAYRRSYNQYRFDASAARKAGDNGLASRAEMGAESAAYQYGEKLRASSTYLRSADESLEKMMPAKLVSEQKTVATEKLPVGAPSRSAPVKSVTTKEIKDSSGTSIRLVNTRYADNKEFTSMVVGVRGNNGNVVPMNMPVPSTMMALPEKVAVSEAKGYVKQAIAKMDDYEVLYQKSAAGKSRVYSAYTKNLTPEEAAPKVVGGQSASASRATLPPAAKAEAPLKAPLPAEAVSSRLKQTDEALYDFVKQDERLMAKLADREDLPSLLPDRPISGIAKQIPAKDDFARYLNVREEVMLEAYTGGGNFNQKLRGGASMSECIGCKDLDSALSKLPAYEGVTYRGDSLVGDRLKEFTTVGNTVSDKGFMSTTRDLQRVHGFGNYTEGGEKAVFLVSGRSGRSIENAADFAYEKEVLFRPNTKFKVEMVHKQADGTNVVLLRELADDSIPAGARAGRAPAAVVDDPSLIGARANGPAASYDPRTLQEMADRRVNWVLKQHAEFSEITAADNRKFMDLAARAEKGQAKESFFVTENAVLKRLNDDVVKDKDFVTALDNLHKEVLLREIKNDPVLKDVVAASYNDYKSIGFALKRNDPQIRRLLDEKIARTNEGFDGFLKKVETARGWKEKSIGLASDLRTWHHSGIGNTFQEAGLAARRSREIALESGQARLVNFTEESAHYTAATDRLAARSDELAKKFKTAAFVEKTPHGVALSEEAIETIRKAKPLGKSEADMNKAVQVAIGRRYGRQISEQEAALLRSQLKDIDSLNPSLLIERRVEINMGLHDEGLVSFDFKGQNSRNLYQTQMAVLKTKGQDIKTRLRAIAEGDRIATAQLDDMKARVEKAVASLGEKYVGKDVSKVVQKSGDDGIFHPLAPLGPAEKAKLARALSEQKVSDSVRLTYLPKTYRNSDELIPVVERNRLVVEAEKIEKDLFTEYLVGKLPDDVFKGLEIKVDLVPAKEGKSAVGITFGHAAGKSIPAKAEEIARSVLKDKYDITSVERTPTSASFLRSYSPQKVAKKLDSADVFKSTQRWAADLEKMGAKISKADQDTQLRVMTRHYRDEAPEIIPMKYTDGRSRGYYGEVFKIDELPPPAAKGSASTTALRHPQMKAYAEGLRRRGYELVTDTSMRFTDTGAYFSPQMRVISLSPHSTWADFLHEVQHAEFYELISKHNSLEQFRIIRLEEKKDLLKSLDPEYVKYVGADKIRKIQSLLDRGITPQLAIDESLSVQAELKALGWKRYVPGGNGPASYRYMLRHQITELENLGSSMTDQQRNLVATNKLKHTGSKVAEIAAYPTLAGGVVYGGHQLYFHLSEENVEQVLYDAKGNAFVRLKDGSVQYVTSQKK